MSQPPGDAGASARGDGQRTGVGPLEDEAGHQLGFLLLAAAVAVPAENPPDSDATEAGQQFPGEFPQPAALGAVTAQEVADLVQPDQVPVPWAGISVDENVVSHVRGHPRAGQAIRAVQARQRQDVQRPLPVRGDDRGEGVKAERARDLDPAKALCAAVMKGIAEHGSTPLLRHRAGS